MNSTKDLLILLNPAPQLPTFFQSWAEGKKNSSGGSLLKAKIKDVVFRHFDTSWF